MATSIQQSETSIGLFPQGGWDVHHHIFEPTRFCYAPDRHLTPPPATVQQFINFKRSLGITNSVLTHGLSYGNDCTSLTAFIAELGKSQTKGVSVVDPSVTTDEEIDTMHAAGVRGVRVNLYKFNAMHDVELQKTALREHARRVQRRPGWTMAFTHTHPEFWPDLRSVVENELAPMGVRLLTDHFALLKADSMVSEEYRGNVTSQPGFQDIVELLRKGLLWIKLSAPYRVSKMGPHYADLQVVVRALVDANPYRVVWGSDWPHTPLMKVRSHEEALKETPYLVIDDLAWLTSLRSWLLLRAADRYRSCDLMEALLILGYST